MRGKRLSASNTPKAVLEKMLRAYMKKAHPQSTAKDFRRVLAFMTKLLR